MEGRYNQPTQPASGLLMEMALMARTAICVGHVPFVSIQCHDGNGGVAKSTAGTLKGGGGHHSSVSWYNYLTVNRSICLLDVATACVRWTLAQLVGHASGKTLNMYMAAPAKRHSSPADHQPHSRRLRAHSVTNLLHCARQHGPQSALRLHAYTTCPQRNVLHRGKRRPGEMALHKHGASQPRRAQHLRLATRTCPHGSWHCTASVCAHMLPRWP